MKRIITSLCLLVLSCFFAFAACGKTNSESSVSVDPESSSSVSFESSHPIAVFAYSVEKTSETRVVIRVAEATVEYTLAQVMEMAKEAGKLTYEASDGMVKSIEGKANAADYSSCWMLYTSDTELSNTEWGTITVDGNEFGSAIVGMNDLPVIAGGTYVWEYVTF